MVSADTIIESSGSWGYLVIFLIIFGEAIPFLGPFIPAQLFLLGAGFLARLHHLDLLTVWAVALVALYLADIVSFSYGRRYGLAFFKRLPKAVSRKAVGLSEGLATHLRKSLIIAQFLGPARALTPPLAGSAKVPWSKFLLWNAIGCVLWVSTIVGLGWLFGESYRVIHRHLGRDAIVFVLLAIVVYFAVSRYRSARKEEREGESEQP